MKKVVVRIARIVVDACFQLKDRDWEDRRLAIAQPRPNRVERRKTAFRGSIHTIVDGGKWDLRTGAAVKCVEVVNQRFHRLMRFLDNVVTGQKVDPFCIFLASFVRILIRMRQHLCKRFRNRRNRLLGTLRLERFIIKAGVKINRLFKSLAVDTRIAAQCVKTEAVEDSALGFPIERFVKGLFHALRHGVVKGIDALTTKHIVLVRLDGDTGQRGIGTDRVRFAKEAMPRRKAAVKEL